MNVGLEELSMEEANFFCQILQLCVSRGQSDEARGLIDCWFLVIGIS